MGFTIKQKQCNKFLQSKELLHDQNKCDDGYEMKLHFGKEYVGNVINV